MSVINYESLIDQAMHVIVRNSLQTIKDGCLPGNHHFYISFLTNHPQVKISNTLKAKYPEEMTIVLQFQFDDLVVTEDGFSVTLSFDGTRERLTVPFSALTAFADPSVKFGLQFKHVNKNGNYLNEIEATSENQAIKELKENDVEFDNVVALDTFKKKRKS